MLSSPSRDSGLVQRKASCVVNYLDENATPRAISATGSLAGLLQHECDMLQGIDFVDRYGSGAFLSLCSTARCSLVCVCVCVCVCMHVYVYVCIHVSMYVYVYMCVIECQYFVVCATNSDVAFCDVAE
jgi:Polypeptide deformylase